MTLEERREKSEKEFAIICDMFHKNTRLSDKDILRMLIVNVLNEIKRDDCDKFIIRSYIYGINSILENYPKTE